MRSYFEPVGALFSILYRSWTFENQFLKHPAQFVTWYIKSKPVIKSETLEP